MSQSTPNASPGGGYDRQVRYGRIVGLFFSLAGFTTIGFGWNGMAKVACPDCQLPYLLSGGAAGLGLILVGVALLVMAQIRDERIKLTDQLRQLGAALGRVASLPALAAAPERKVVAGKSTYHRLDCRLVEGKTDLDVISVEVARLGGLSPCRVCNPPEPEADGHEPTAAARSSDSTAEPGPPSAGSGDAR